MILLSVGPGERGAGGVGLEWAGWRWRASRPTGPALVMRYRTLGSRVTPVSQTGHDGVGLLVATCWWARPIAHPGLARGSTASGGGRLISPLRRTCATGGRRRAIFF